MKVVKTKPTHLMRSEIATPENDMSLVKDILGYFLITIVAFGLRLLHLWAMKDTHLFSFLMGDPEIYDLLAREIAKGNWLGDQIFFQAPFYPYFLGLVYTIFGRDLFVVSMIQIFLGTISCLLIAGSGKYFFSRKIGMLAGMILAIYPTAIYFDCLIQKASFGLFFMALLLFLLGKIVRHANWTHWLLVGLVLGCFVLVRENALILVFVLLLWLFLQFRRQQKKRLLLWSTTFVLGVILILFPVALRNKLVGDEFVLTTSNFGLNLYIGNSEKSIGTYTALVWGRADWRFEQKDATELAERALKRKLSPSEVSNYWVRKTIDYVGSNPAHWIRLMAKKWLLIWNAVEVSDTESQYAHYDRSYVLKGIGFFLHFGIIAPLAFFGICASWKSRSRIWVLYLMLASYAASISLFFVFARFRHPMVTILVLFAAAGIIEGFKLFREKKIATMLLCLSIAFTTAIIANWKIISKSVNTSNTYYNLAVSLESQGNMKEAIHYYRKSLQLNPSHTMAHNNFGIALWMQGNSAEAVEHFYEALRINPDMARTHNNLGIVLYDLGRIDESLDHFQTVIKINPDYGAHVYYNIACILARQKEIEASVLWLKKAIAKGYNNWNHLKADPDLEIIRETEGYKEIIRDFTKDGPNASSQ